MIRRLLLLIAIFAVLALSAFADTRSLYTVKDIKVSEQGENIIEAQQAAFTVARRIGAQRMIERITLPEARAAAGGVVVDNELGARLAAAVDVQEETRGGGQYRATLAVVLNPRQVRAYLRGKNIPFIDTQAPLSLVVPLASDDLVGDWQEAWGERDDGKLAPYVTSQSPYTVDADWAQIQGDVGIMKARRGVTALLNGAPGGYSVTLAVLTATERTELGTTQVTRSLDDAVNLATAKLDDVWRRASIVSSTTRTIASASVRYTSLAEWNTLRTQLPRSPLVTDFRIRAISSDGALVEFSFADDVNRLRTDLRQRGIALDQDATGLIIKSAVSGVVR